MPGRKRCSVEETHIIYTFLYYYCILHFSLSIFFFIRLLKSDFCFLSFKENVSVVPVIHGTAKQGAITQSGNARDDSWWGEPEARRAM